MESLKKEVWNQVYQQVVGQISDQVWDQVYWQVEDQVWNRVFWTSLGKSLQANLQPSPRPSRGSD